MGRRTVAELKKFYRSIINGADATLADKMRAAGRLQKLYDAETAQKPVAAPARVTKEQALAAIASVTGKQGNA